MCHLEGTPKIISASSSEKMAHIWNERERILAELCRYASTWAHREYTALRTTSALGIKEQSKADPVSMETRPGESPECAKLSPGSDDTEPVRNNSLWRNNLHRCAGHRDQGEHRGKQES